MRQVAFTGQESDMAEIMRAVDCELKDAACVGKAREQLEIAIEEVCVNVIKHAFPAGASAAFFTIWTEMAEHRFVVQVVDDGAPFDPLAHPNPDLTLSAEQRKIGGLGIFMSKKCTDCMTYERRQGKNVLTMTKVF